jgi:phosphoribosylpyrophosphate synthetase
MAIKHNVSVGRVYYPFGEKMDSNTTSVNILANEFLNVAKEDITSSKEICLVCMGSSGSIIAAMFYKAIREKYTSQVIKICHVKKDGESSHGSRISGLSSEKNSLYVWVDDFIDRGQTVIDCHNLIIKHGSTGFYSGRVTNDFKFDYVVCTTISCLDKVESLTNNLIYNYK